MISEGEMKVSLYDVTLVGVYASEKIDRHNSGEDRYKLIVNVITRIKRL